MDLNVCSFTGKLGKDPEKRQTTSGTKVVGFSLAVSGRKKDDVMWLNCSAFGKLAEIIAEYATKGRTVAVSGSLNIRKYEAKDGTEKTSTEINVSEFSLIGPNPNKGSASESPEGSW